MYVCTLTRSQRPSAIVEGGIFWCHPLWSVLTVCLLLRAPHHLPRQVFLAFEGRIYILNEASMHDARANKMQFYLGFILFRACTRSSDPDFFHAFDFLCLVGTIECATTSHSLDLYMYFLCILHDWLVSPLNILVKNLNWMVITKGESSTTVLVGF